MKHPWRNMLIIVAIATIASTALPQARPGRGDAERAPRSRPGDRSAASAPASGPAGTEYRASAQNKGTGRVGANCELWLPAKAKNVRGVFVLVANGNSDAVYRDAHWRALCEELPLGLMHLHVRVTNRGSSTEENPNRNAAIGGGEALLAMLESLAGESKHPELQHAPVLPWGHSATGTFCTTFAMTYPQRTIAFIRYNSHLRGLQPDYEKIRNIPCLVVTSERDNTAGVPDGRDFVQAGRKLGAPWTFGMQASFGHAGVDGVLSASSLMRPWVRAIVAARLPKKPSADAPVALRTVEAANGWLGDDATRKIAPFAEYAGDKAAAYWLPDKSIAEIWKIWPSGATAIAPAERERSPAARLRGSGNNND